MTEMTAEKTSSETSEHKRHRVPVVVVGDNDNQETSDPNQVEVVDQATSPEAGAPEVQAESDHQVDPETAAPVGGESESEIAVSQDPVSEPVSENPFASMGLVPAVLEAIEAAGYRTPTPIQEQTIPHVTAGKDLIGQAETGSGKTAAFAWPILSRINVETNQTQVLVLAPTRELAVQVTQAFRKYAGQMPGFRATTIYGGQDYETQFRALDRGAHVVVGTPGRLIDHLQRGTLDLSQLKTLVLDEADEMLRMGFLEDVEMILEKTPGNQQSLFFSATMPPPIKNIAERYLQQPVHVKIKSNTATADSIEQSCLMVEPREKLQRLVRLLETEDTDAVLVFVKTRHSAVVVTEHLIQNGIIASALNGDIPQTQRERTVSQLKSGKIKIVVATDVAARGLDVSRISHVINYDFPNDTEAYVHRIGRTGRAGRQGHAVLFVEPREKGKLARLQRETNQPIEPFKQKSIKEINANRIARFKQRIQDTTEDAQMGFFTELIHQLQEESDLPLDQIAAALAVMAQGETPLLLEALKSPASNRKSERGKKSHRTGPMQTFRVEVGRNDGVGPGNLVGAITNEANLSNADIGRIRIFDRFSTIDLPADFPQDLVDHLSEVVVSGRPLQITRTDQTYDDQRGGRRGGTRQNRHRSNADRPPRGGRPGGKRGGKPSWKTRRSNDAGTYRAPAAERSQDQESSSASGSRPPRKPGKSNGPTKKYVKVRGAKKRRK